MGREMSSPDRHSPLDDLASHGLQAIPASRFLEAAEDCAARASATGDARYPILHQVMGEVLDWWTDHDERGGIPAAVVSEINGVITQQLPIVLALEQPTDGYAAAVRLADDLRALRTGPEEWIARGYLKPPPAE
jgi:hypothetical protein